MIVYEATKNEQKQLQDKVQKIQNQIYNQGFFSDIEGNDRNFKKTLQHLIQQEKDHLPTKSFIRIQKEFFLYGPIDELVHLTDVTEIIINDQENIWIEKNGQLLKHHDQFLSKESFHRIFHKICEEAQCEISSDQPFANGKWLNFRLHAISPPVASNYQLSLRRKNHWTDGFNFFLKNQTLTSQQHIILKDLIRKKQTAIIIGPTGSGKTSLLNAFLQELPENERVVIIEDTDEITPPNTSSSKLLTQPMIKDRSLAIDQTELVKQSLRMRPDRIILGEIRGKESKDLLLALSTGHQGSFCTLHADSAGQALMRLEMLIQLGAPQWSLSTIRSLIALSIQYIILIEKVEIEDCSENHFQRQVTNIHRINGVEKFGILLEKVI